MGHYDLYSLIGLSKVERPILDHHTKAHNSWNPADFTMKSSRFHLKSGRFHLKSSGFQVKSTQNLINSDVSTKTIQFDKCRRGAMTLDFMKSGVIAPSMHPPKLKSFCWNIWIYKVLGGFHLKPTRFHLKSTGFHADSMKSGGFHVKSKDLLQGIVTLCFMDFFQLPQM